jgi:hypothetical protein
MALRPGNCGGFDESSRPLTGLGSGEWYESRFHRKCIDGGYADIGHRRGAVGIKDFLRHLSRKLASNKRPPVEGVRDETHHFRGGGSFLFLIAREDIRARSYLRYAPRLVHDPGAFLRAARND